MVNSQPLFGQENRQSSAARVFTIWHFSAIPNPIKAIALIRLGELG